MQRKTALAAVVLAAFALPATADNFAGYYYGANLGLGQSKTSFEQSITKPNLGNGGNLANHTATIQETNSLHPEPSSTDFTGGGQAGYNWSYSRAVLGGEFDLNYWGLKTSASASASHAVSNGTRMETTTNSANARYIATLRLRAGFLVTESSMAYVSGGVAQSDLRLSNATTISGGSIGVAQGIYNATAKPSMGHVYGVGFEQAWSERTTWRIEWQHVYFNHQSVTAADEVGASPTNPNQTDLARSSLTVGSKLKTDFIRLGMNWKF